MDASLLTMFAFDCQPDAVKMQHTYTRIWNDIVPNIAVKMIY